MHIKIRKLSDVEVCDSIRSFPLVGLIRHFELLTNKKGGKSMKKKFKVLLKTAAFISKSSHE